MAGVAGSSSDAHLSTSAAAPREKRRHSGGSQFQFSQCVTCPICEKSFSIHKIEAHASRCAERSGVVAAARRSHKKKKCKTRAGAAAVVTIDVNMIDGYEFRSQTALEALGPEAGAPDEVPTLHPPAPVSAPAPSLRLKGVARQGAAPPVLLSWGRGTSSHGAARPSLPAPAASGSSEAAVLDAEVIRRRAAVLDAACPAPDPPAASLAGQSSLFPAGRGAGRRPSAPGCKPSGAAPARAPAPAGVEVADVTPEGYAFKVAEALSGDPATLKSFVQTMKAFEEGRAGTVEVMRDVSACLANHRPLLAQFNAFLPKGYRVEALPRTLSAYAACTDDPGSITQEAAVGLASSFVERLCARYANRPRKLEQMHALLAAMPFDEPLAALTPQSCTRMPSGALGLCRSFGPLLSDEPDLLREFMQYVPPSCTATQHIHLVPLPER